MSLQIRTAACTNCGPLQPQTWRRRLNASAPVNAYVYQHFYNNSIRYYHSRGNRDRKSPHNPLSTPSKYSVWSSGTTRPSFGVNQSQLSPVMFPYITWIKSDSWHYQRVSINHSRAANSLAQHQANTDCLRSYSRYTQTTLNTDVSISTALTHTGINDVYIYIYLTMHTVNRIYYLFDEAAGI